jgi:hypothetical protein
MTKKRDAYDEQLLRDYGLQRVPLYNTREIVGFAGLVVVFLLVWIGAMLWLTYLSSQA